MDKIKNVSIFINCMNLFTRWAWIKRNWLEIVAEASLMDLIFVGGTSLNFVAFEEYRASEDIDLYNPDSKGIDNPNGRSEEELAKLLSEKLLEKGYEIKNIEGKSFSIGPNIKVEIFHDATMFKKIKKIHIEGRSINIFDNSTYAEMKMAALLCRTVYDPRDLVDVFILQDRGKVHLLIPDRECEVMEHAFGRRIEEIRKTKMQDLLLFQNKEQVDILPYDKFNEFKRGLVERLPGFL